MPSVKQVVVVVVMLLVFAFFVGKGRGHRRERVQAAALRCHHSLVLGLSHDTHRLPFYNTSVTAQQQPLISPFFPVHLYSQTNVKDYIHVISDLVMDDYECKWSNNVIFVSTPHGPMRTRLI